MKTPSEQEIIEAFDEWIHEENKINGGISEQLCWEKAIAWLLSLQSNVSSQPEGEVSERVMKLLFEDDFKEWRYKEGWRYHNDGHYWYKLDSPSDWPPRSQNVKFPEDLKALFLNQYQSAYVNEWLQSLPSKEVSQPPAVSEGEKCKQCGANLNNNMICWECNCFNGRKSNHPSPKPDSHVEGEGKPTIYPKSLEEAEMYIKEEKARIRKEKKRIAALQWNFEVKNWPRLDEPRTLPGNLPYSIGVDTLRKGVNCYLRDQISLSRFAEILNEDAYNFFKANPSEGEEISYAPPFIYEPVYNKIKNPFMGVDKTGAPMIMLSFKDGIVKFDCYGSRGEEPETKILLDEIMGMSHYQDELTAEITSLKSQLASLKSSQHTGVRWIRASERLPIHKAHWNVPASEKNLCQFIIRTKDGLMVADIYDESTNGDASKMMIRTWSGHEYFDDDFANIEWLDESNKTPPSE